MITTIRTTSLLLALLLFTGISYTKEPEGVEPRKRTRTALRTAEDCLPPTASAQLDINNVRTLLHNGGDMWWDLVGNPRYEVPKGGGKSSLFAGSLWIGGIDDASQIRVAAQTYRQSGYDFWPGPLTNDEAAIDAETCERFDKMYKINKAEIDRFRADFADGKLDKDQSEYPNVFAWPTGTGSDGLVNSEGNQPRITNPDDGSTIYLAPWVENVEAGSGNPEDTYNPELGDYPRIRGDQAIWWVINDKGDVHTETGGEPIGVEIHMMAFAFTTANAINDMTFYDQLVINRSSTRLNETYIGQWVDPDVGFFRDDYVGCDIDLGLGMCYNGDANDETANGYGANPPAVGVDFFQGPKADPQDSVDNDRDGIVDEEGETIIMSKFVYYNNDFSLQGNPEVATHYYGYLRGIWKDGTEIVDNYTNGGSGNGYSPSSPGDPTDYMFSGNPCQATGWTEKNAGNPAADRRFIQSAGPFTLQPGAINRVITGVVWARGFYQDEIGSVCELYRADKIAQALFDNNFTLLDGPDAPEVNISELNRELHISWGYQDQVRNNFNESYAQADPVLKADGVADSLFDFQGYLIYQLLDETVGPNELNDPDRARVVAQCDVKDGVGVIINRSEQSVGPGAPPLITDEVMVQGSDNGIFNSVQVTDDLFAEGDDKRLKNYTTYYFAAIAYAYNDTASDGRKFVQGNRFFEVNAAVPHPTEFEKKGTALNASYGDFIPVTMVAGLGNGGNFVKIAPETENKILAAPYKEEHITYVADSAPVQVKVIDPKNLQPGYYQLRVTQDKAAASGHVFVGADSCGDIWDSTLVEWELWRGDNPGNFPDLIHQATYIQRIGGCASYLPRPQPLVGTERGITGYGLSIAIKDVDAPADTLDEESSGTIGGATLYDDPTQQWLVAQPDQIEAFAGGAWNWALGGREGRTLRDFKVYDPHDHFSNLATGWAPFCLAREFINSDQLDETKITPGLAKIETGPSYTNKSLSAREIVTLDQLPDVDIVFTKDITKWSRCMVVETTPNVPLGTGAWLLSGKWSDNIDDPNQILNNPDNPQTVAKTTDRHAMSWFPGYAINVNTGERLNVFFGENEWDVKNRGNDLIFNPTGDVGNLLTNAGGRHYVYVSTTRYDEFASIKDLLTNADTEPDANRNDAIGTFPTGNNLAQVYNNVSWVGIPMLAQGFENINGPADYPTDVRVALRVNQPFGSREGQDDVPTFEFNTMSLAANTQQVEVAKTALDDIRVVPNPYYAYSAYERSQLSNVVKLTNLPQQCKVSIYTLNGHLVRSFNKNSDAPDQNWDLRNQAGVPVASGVYVIHIDAGDLGTKVVKLMAVMRQVDLNSF